MKRKIYFKTIGCPRRFLDAEKIKKYYKKNNWQILKSPKKADVIFFTSCGVDKKVEKACIAELKKLQKMGNQEIIVSGCLPKINTKSIKSLEIDKTVDVKNLNKLDSYYPDHKFKLSKISEANVLLDNDYKKKDLFFLHIQRGCLGKCSYCGIKKAIGILKSKDLKECLAEYKKGLDLGYRKFSIEGDDVGAYGIDRKTNFPTLLRELLNYSNNVQLAIQDFHPVWLNNYKNELEELLISPQIKKFVCMIQSGSKEILKKMSRDSRIDSTMRILKKIKTSNPLIFFSTTVIIGFPSESESDFKKTIKVLQQEVFDEVLVFPYSNRPNTVAAKMLGQIAKELIVDRVERLKEALASYDIVVRLDPKKASKQRI